jgi:hypothetical protein
VNKAKREYIRKIMDLADLLDSTGGLPQMAYVSLEIWEVIKYTRAISRTEKPIVFIRPSKRLEPTEIRVGPLSLMDML